MTFLHVVYYAVVLRKFLMHDVSHTYLMGWDLGAFVRICRLLRAFLVIIILSLLVSVNCSSLLLVLAYVNDNNNYTVRHKKLPPF